MMNDFMVTGGDELAPPAGATAEPLHISDLDAFIAYVSALPQPVKAPNERRIERITP